MTKNRELFSFQHRKGSKVEYSNIWCKSKFVLKAFFWLVYFWHGLYLKGILHLKDLMTINASILAKVLQIYGTTC